MSRTVRWMAPTGLAALIALVAMAALMLGALSPAEASRAQGNGSAGSGTPSATGPSASGGTAVAASELAATSHDPVGAALSSGGSSPTSGRPSATTSATASRSTRTNRVPATTVPATPTTVSGASGSGSVLFGVVTDTTAELQAFDSDAGKKATLYSTYASFAYNSDFDATSASNLVAQGVQPMITWEPWDPGFGGATQPAYSLASIVSGNYDTYITRWANEIKGWDHPLWLRFAHEMNGDWYPWGAGVNGNTPAQYVAAWRHVHDLFQQIGATNVTWVWTPNTLMGSSPTLASLYPGDSYVDVIGVDGYNWGTTQSWGSTWQTPSQVFAPTISALEQISARPIMIGETASTEIGGNKATWISQFFSYLALNPRIKAFVWFNLNKETDWRIESSPSARSAFAAGVANPRYA